MKLITETSEDIGYNITESSDGKKKACHRRHLYAS